MAHAVTLALRARGRTHPNPMVGCVITHHGEVVAQGFHQRAGSPHAEIEALRRLELPADQCDLYVTLEPCCIHGRTPPCTDAILRGGFKRVFIGSRDPDPRVDGRGASILRAAGVEVIEGVLKARCDALVMPFAKRALTGKPWLVAKYAMTLDGKIATATGDSAWITGERARHHVHQLRDQLDAILVGKNTLLADNPKLTCRISGGRDPVRAVIDPGLEAGAHFNVYDTEASSARAMVFARQGADAEAARKLEARGVEVIYLVADERGFLPIDGILSAIGARGCNSLLVEGGQALLGSLWDARQVDEVCAYIAPKIMGGQASLGPIGGLGQLLASESTELEQVSVEQFGSDWCMRGLVPRAKRAHDLASWLGAP